MTKVFSKISGLTLVLLLMVTFVAAMACGDDKEKATIIMSEEGTTFTGLQDAIFTKVLAEMDYVGEEVLVDVPAMWAGLATGGIDVSLDLWPNSNQEKVQKYVDDEKTIELVGPIGLRGTNDWYVPTFVIEGDPARGIAAVAPDLKSYEQLNKYKDLFATVETGSKGRFLDAFPSYGPIIHNEERIEALGLDYEVVFSGSSAATIAEVDAAFQRGEPILIYFWQPSFLHTKYDLTVIEVPPYTDECYATESFACGIPSDEIQIAVRLGFQDDFPDVYQLLQNMTNFTNDDMNEMQWAVEQGSTIDEAVDTWMAANDAKWRAWIP